MMIKLIKQGLSLAVVLAFLAGCSSTDTVDEDAAAAAEAERSGVTTGTSGREGMGSRSDRDEEAESLERIVYFDFDQAVLKPQTRALLLAHAERLRNNPVNVRLEGHTDERGTREYNMALGERRANAVRDFLVLQGVPRNSIEVVSYGEERPLASGSNERAWGQNRRVEIKY
ncbi:peptidoglycan-associated lipoprotein Pal [Marinimicrobium alkaliphilum]|uniref:peptidoglycan-associated lipoprotein Pal n=1 Tax=Marinimicrobium alkaliphilum TaxID=2202654 RepID=UPI0038CC1760